MEEDCNTFVVWIGNTKVCTYNDIDLRQHGYLFFFDHEEWYIYIYFTVSLSMSLVPIALMNLYPDRFHYLGWYVCTMPPIDSPSLHVFPGKFPLGGVIEK